MWIHPQWNQLFSPSHIQGGCSPQQGEYKSCGWIYPTPEIKAFLGLVGHYQWFIKGFACVAQPLYDHLSGEDTGKKNEWVMLISNVQVAFETLKKVCLEAYVLALDFDKPFLLETNSSKLGLGVVLLQKKPDGWYHPVAYVSQSLTTHKPNYHSTEQEFFGLEVGNCCAVPRIPTLETVCCENWK